MIEGVFEKLLYSLHQMGREQSGDAWESEISTSLEMLREEYEQLTVENRGEIDYANLSTQTAYVYAYAIGRAEFTYQLLKRYRAKLGQPIFRNKEARITSLGGGPGSEIAGVVKYLLDSASGEKVESIKYWVFDKDGDWAHPCQALVDELSAFIPIDIVFDTLDLCDQNACKNISLEGDDLLMLSFVISEVCTVEKSSDVLESLRGLYKTMDSGSRIFYNDSNASSFYYFFNASRKFVKGLGRSSEVSEIKDKISMSLKFGLTYQEFNDEFGSTPHLTSDALSKLLVRL